MIQQILDAVKSRNAELLEGTNLEVDLPLTDELVNAALQTQLADLEEVKKLVVQFVPGDQVLVHTRVQVDAGLFNVNLPEKTLRLQFEPPAGLPGDPVIVLRITGGLSGLERKLLHVFDRLISKKFPRGVKLDDDHIRIDLSLLLERENMGHLAEYVQSLSLGTEPGRLLIKTHIEVPS